MASGAISEDMMTESILPPNLYILGTVESLFCLCTTNSLPTTVKAAAEYVIAELIPFPLVHGGLLPCLDVLAPSEGHSSPRVTVFAFCMVRLAKTESKAQKDDEEQPRLQQERRIFDVPAPLDVNQLAPNEIWWSQHFDWLKDRGYLLRPRYAPNWVPSWKGTKKDRFVCEDGNVPMVSSLKQSCVPFVSSPTVCLQIT